MITSLLGDLTRVWVCTDKVLWPFFEWAELSIIYVFMNVTFLQVVSYLFYHIS